MKVLLVDDSAKVRTRLASMVHEIGGVDVKQAANADEAFAMLAATAFAIVIVDIHMQPRSGLELLSALHGSDALVVAMSNEPNEPLRRACIARGARHFLDKARDFQRMVELVRRARLPSPP